MLKLLQLKTLAIYMKVLREEPYLFQHQEALVLQLFRGSLSHQAANIYTQQAALRQPICLVWVSLAKALPGRFSKGEQDQFS